MKLGNVGRLCFLFLEVFRCYCMKFKMERRFWDVGDFENENSVRKL